MPAFNGCSELPYRMQLQVTRKPGLTGTPPLVKQLPSRTTVSGPEPRLAQNVLRPQKSELVPYAVTCTVFCAKPMLGNVTFDNPSPEGAMVLKLNPSWALKFVVGGPAGGW